MIISGNHRHGAVKTCFPVRRCCCLFPARSHGDAGYTIYWHLATSYFVPLSSLESPTCLLSEKVQASSGRPHVDLLNTRRSVEKSVISPNVNLSQTPTGQGHLDHLWPSQRSLWYYERFTRDERESAGSARELVELKRVIYTEQKPLFSWPKQDNFKKMFHFLSFSRGFQRFLIKTILEPQIKLCLT